MSVHGELAGGAAQRSRERRLRSWLRHERQTVAMVLAEACHHSSGSFPPTLKERKMAGQDAYEALQDGQDSLSLCCRSDKFQLSVLTAWMRVVFLGPCTQVLGREPCPQGHGSHN